MSRSPTSRQVFDIIARDGASGSFRRIGKEAEGAGLSIDKLGKAAAGMTVVFAAFAANEAAKFEQSMTRISTQAGVPIGQIKELSKQVLNLAPKVGTGPDELATSLYHVESAFRTTGISAKNALGIVENAAKLAKIGGANLEDTTQAIIGVLSSGIKGVKDAADAAAQINQLVGAGDTTLTKVVAAVGTGILPTAQALGLSFKDVSAALATLTDNATPADEAATRLRTTFSLIEKPTSQAQAALESIGLSSTSLAEDFRKPDGLLVAMEDLKTHLEQTYPSSRSTKLSIGEIQAATKSYTQALLTQGVTQKAAIDLGSKYEESLKKGGSAATLQAQTILAAFGGAKSGATFLTLYEELTRLQSKYKDFGTSAQAAAKFGEAWANQQATAKQKLDDLRASWDVFLVRAGNAILPTLKKITDALAKHPVILEAAAGAVALLAAAWTVDKFATAFSIIGRLKTAILGLGAASTTAAAESTVALGGIATRTAAGSAAGIVALDGSAAALGGLGAGKGASSAYAKLFAGTDAAATAGRFSGAGLLGGASLGAAVTTGGLVAAADLGFAFGLDHILSKYRSVKDIPKLDAFFGKPGFIENNLPGVRQAEVKAGVITPLQAQTDETKKQLADYVAAGTKVADKMRNLLAGGQGNSELAKNLQVQGYLISQAIAATQKKLADQQVAAYLQALAKSTRNTAAGAERNIPYKSKDPLLQFLGLGPDLKPPSHSDPAVDAFVKSTTSNFNKAAGLIKDLAKGLGEGVPEKVAEGIIARKQKMIDGLAKGLTDPQKQALYILEALATQGGENLTGNLAHAIQTHTPLVVSSAEALKLGTNKQIAEILKDWNITVTVDDQASWSLKQIRDYANKLIDLGLGTAATVSIAAQGGSHGFGAGRSATGGPIVGPGTGTSDSIPRWLSNGEYVIRASSVKQYGLGLFDALNAGRMAGGGLVASSGIILNEDAATSKLLGIFQGAASGASVGGGAQQWAPLVLQVLGMLGQSASWLPNVLRQINTESGGNPNAINLWDSNAAKGTPSKGILQTIDPTFYAYAGPYAALGPFNAFADTFAALRYTLARYGSLGVLGQGHGYALGTRSATRGWARVGERGPEWVNFGGGETVLPNGQSPLVNGSLVSINEFHAHDHVDIQGVAQQIALKARAAMTAVRV